MADKMTKRDLFGAVIGILTEVGADESLVAGMLHEVDLLDRKHNASPNPKREAEKRAAKAAIAATLRAGGAMRATAIAAVNDMSVQRVSAMLRQMVAEETVTRSTEGKVTTFTLK